MTRGPALFISERVQVEGCDLAFDAKRFQYGLRGPSRNDQTDNPADATVREAAQATGRKRLLVAGLLTEACVSFPALSAVREGYEVFVVADACGGLTQVGHEIALRRPEQAGVRLTSWFQVLLEFQRDWTHHETYEAARAIVVENGGGYGMGFAYAREMIHPA
jgi:nicotinamidase-related amidase